MTLLQTQPGVAASEIPTRGSNDLVRLPRVSVLNQQHADECVIDTALARRLLDEEGYTSPRFPSVVVYRIREGNHEQTGIVVEASVRDYREGRIRGHEATQPERERRLDMATAEAGFEQLPVTLTHRDGDGLSALLEKITATEPQVRLSSDDDHVHTVWVADDAELVRAARAELGDIDRLYIADGHHRMAAAERYASRRANPASAFTLAVLFPSEQMRVFGYHRCMSRPAGYSTGALLAAAAAQPGSATVRPYAQSPGSQPGRGEVAMRLDGQWYVLTLNPSGEDAGVRDSLEAVRLDEAVLTPLAQETGLDPRSDVTPVPGGSTESFARWCDERGSIGFLPPKPSVEHVMAVSDAGQVMPPKSTWFSPKANAGVFIRQLR